MAQRSDLPSFYGERTSDGAVVQRPSPGHDAEEPIRAPPKSVHRRAGSQNSLIPYREPLPNPLNDPLPRRQPEDRHDVFTAEGPDRRNTRDDPDRRDTRRDSGFDWDREARRRVQRERRRSDACDPRTPRDGRVRRGYNDRDPYSDYDDYYSDRRRFFDERRDERMSRRETMRPPSRRRPRSEDLSDDYENYTDKSKKHSESLEIPMRIPLTTWMNSTLKNHFVATLGEFVGTTMFLFFAFAGTQVANVNAPKAAGTSTSGGATGFNPEVLLYIALVFGFSLMVNVWVFFRISGGLFNPAVTFAMILVNSLPIFRGFLLLGAQVAGSIFASFLVKILFPTPLNVRTTLAAGTSVAQGVFIEAILTAELVFTIFMLAKEKHKATFIAPVGIGLALFIAELVGVFYTGGSLNPARSLGPCVVTGTFDKEHWIYWVGPGTGAIIAVVFYKFIKILEYEMANPGQDGDDANDPTKNPNHEVKQVHEANYGK